MRSHLRFASVVGAFALSTVAIAPAMAAAPVSQAGANAVTVSVAGNQQGTGDTTAKNDGTTETKTGNATPPLSVLGGQQLINAGVLAQESTARADGTSAACAGLAGSGGSVVNIGGSSCLDPGTPVNLTLGNLDLTNVTVVSDPSSPLAQLNGVTGPILEQIAPLINQAVTALNAQLGDLGLVAGFGAVEGRCTAELGSASGDATLVDSAIKLQLPGQTVTLLDLPVNPPPNTHLTTDLSVVLTTVLNALKTNLNSAFDGAGVPLNTLIDAIQTNIVNSVVTQVQGQLAPLEDNVLDITLNQQVRSGDSIKVRALDVSVLPVLEDQLDAALVDLQIGNAACGPSGRIAAVEAPQAAAPPAALPTSVSAGYATMPGQHAGQGDDSTNAIVLGAFALLMASAAGFITYRRLHR